MKKIFKTIEEAWQCLIKLKNCYVKVFHGPAGEIVLKDIAQFCRAHESTFNKDPHLAALIEGRREVWLHIQHKLQLTDKQIWSLYKNGE